MIILGIDPGTHESASVLYDGERVTSAEFRSNDDLLAVIRHAGSRLAERMVIEMVEGMGMPVGKETFQTVFWIGRFVEAWDQCNRPWHLVPRGDVKLALCGSKRAKDPHVRQALIDKFGPGKELAIGKKAAPGPLHSVKGHCWQALAAAVAFEISQREAVRV